ncbi:unnamed protein product [Periconia digitata]|uniref:Gfo/Idh/MocA-like oxidoreductase N-terminal domain-containing protein n=1 Tax=Periconia digitata TaxID=1303443 RepID=A0A9W4XPZ5_9PLEO|nr:unnamed protein product [Periconia digitata]
MAPSATTPVPKDSNALSFLGPVPRKMFENPPRILIIGAGSRGNAYAQGTLDSTNGIIAAVAEPVAYKRREFGRKFIWGDDEGGEGKREGLEFVDWRDWVEYETSRRAAARTGSPVPPGIDAVFICVLDEMHEQVLVGIAPLNVHICCEKPLSTSLEKCINIYKALSAVPGGGKEGRDKIFGICHVLRYSPFTMLLRQLVVEEGVVGDVLSVEHVEPVGWWHYSHSYVRGNWRNHSTTAPSLLTKSCHDIDFLLWLLCTPGGASHAHKSTPPHLPSSITSTGSRTFFTKQRKPAQAGPATNCLSCPHEQECIYSARKIYKERHLDKGVTGWPVNVVTPEIEEIYRDLGGDAAGEKLLRDLAEDYTEESDVGEVESRGWYGRCVWESDNDVCDDQHVTIQWDAEEGGGGGGGRTAKTAQFHMVAFTQNICARRGRIYGSLAEIEYDADTIRVHDFRSGQTTVHSPHVEKGGHGGGDTGLARQFLLAVDAVEHGGVEAGDAQRRFLGCDLDEVLRSHAAVFAAEEARVGRKVVEWATWWGERVESRLR